VTWRFSQKRGWSLIKVMKLSVATSGPLATRFGPLSALHRVVGLPLWWEHGLQSLLLQHLPFSVLRLNSIKSLSLIHSMFILMPAQTTTKQKKQAYKLNTFVMGQLTVWPPVQPKLISDSSKFLSMLNVMQAVLRCGHILDWDLHREDEKQFRSCCVRHNVSSDQMPALCPLNPAKPRQRPVPSSLSVETSMLLTDMIFWRCARVVDDSGGVCM